MGRGAEIVVKAKTNTSVYRNLLLSAITIRSAIRLPSQPGCCRWNGIRSEGLTYLYMVNGSLMDANYGIRYTTNSGVSGYPYPKIYSSNMRYLNNYYGIKSEGQYVKFSEFKNNTMEGTLHPQICDCNAINAIDFRDVDPLLPVSIVPSYFKDYNNTISNYEQAFHFSNAKLKVKGFDVSDLRDYLPIGALPDNNPDGDGAIGIDYRWTNSNPSSLDIDYIHFKDFVAEDARSVAVRENIRGGKHTLKATASESLSSITATGVAGGYDLNITSPAKLEVGSIISQNTIQTDGSNSANAGFGITGNFTAANNDLRISDNQINVVTGGSNPLNGGIVLNSTEDLTQNFSIDHNTIKPALISGVGIGVYGARGYCVRRNLMSTSSPATGILLSGGGDATVECNEVLFKPTGVAALLSDENTYSGNFLSGNVNDMHFTGDCSGPAGSTIRWNQFDFSWAPSLVWDNDALTGVQSHNSYNSWTGQGNQGGGNVEVQHNAPVGSQNWTQSKFQRPSNAAVGSIHFPNRSPLGMMTQAPNGTITSIPSTFCTSTSGCSAMLLPLDDPEDDYEALVQDATTWNVLTTAQQTYLRQGIYGLLLENPSWLSGSSTLSGFKASHDGNFVGQSETLRHDWRQLMDDIAAHQVSLQPIHDSLDVLADQLQQWFDAIAADSSLEVSLQGQIDAAIQQGEALGAQLQQAEDQFVPTVQSTVTQLLSQNAVLDGSTQYGWNEKRYNEIALIWLAGTEPDSAAEADLRKMAQTCLPDGGRAVLDARGLCAVWLKEYYDEGNCANLQPRSSGEGATAEMEASPELRIVPNPANDIVWISLQGGTAEGQQVQVFSMDGRQVFSGKLPDSGNLAIPVKGWQGGLYIVKIMGDGMATTRKFMVQHP